jgi:lipoprotein-releasing system permease protein
MAKLPTDKVYKAHISWIAFRNLVNRQKRSGLSFMTITSIFGVAMGVTALIVVLSVMGGFEEDLRSKMLRGQPHLEIMNKTAAAGFGLVQHSVEDFKKLLPEATAVEPFTQSDVVLKQNRHMTSAVLFGIDPTLEDHIWGFNKASVLEGSMDSVGKTHPANPNWDVEVRRPGIAIGVELATQLGAEIGDEIKVVSPQAGMGTLMGGGTVQRSYVISCIFQTGLFNFDAKWAVVSLAEGRKFMPDYDPSLDDDQYVTGIAANLKDPMKVDVTEARLIAAFGAPDQKRINSMEKLAPLSWKKVNKSLLFALKLEKFAMGSILMLIVLVAAFSISGTMMMTVFHKRGQVSLLRSLGMTKGDVAKLYMTHGFIIGTIGIFCGLFFGLALCAVIKSFQFIELPAGIYHLKSLPCKWLWSEYAVICIAAWIFSLIAAAYPAYTASRQDPGAGLRYL